MNSESYLKKQIFIYYLTLLKYNSATKYCIQQMNSELYQKKQIFIYYLKLLKYNSATKYCIQQGKFLK